METIPTARTFLQNLIEENNHDSNIDLEDALIEFAKLHVEQALKEVSERMYSEREVYDILFKHTEYFLGHGERVSLTKWLEQFKKK